jgi:hypothetical protein
MHIMTSTAQSFPPLPQTDQQPPLRSLRLTAALHEVLKDETSSQPRPPLTLGFIIERTGERAFGVLMALLCLPFLLPIPLPGMSIPFGLALLLLGAQIAIRKHRPWLPARLLAWQLPEKVGVRLIGLVAKFFRPLERIIRPRWLFMQNPVAMVLVGIALAIDGFLLSLPLPPIVPFSNALPAWMALVKILGITEEDGISLLAGTLLTLAVALAAIALAIIGWSRFESWGH